MIRDAGAAFVAGCLLAAQAGQLPSIKSGVELIAVDVQVVAGNGQPVGGLQPADFDVRIDGKPRRVVSADFVRYDSTATRVVVAAEPAAPVAATPAPPRRMYLLAVDEQSFDQGSLKAAMQAASRFIDRLRPDDLIGLYAYPTGAAHVDFTSDHAAVKAELPKLTGLSDPPPGQFHMTLSEVVDITAGDQRVFEKVVDRECFRDPSCPAAVRGEALAIGAFLESRISQTLGGLRDLIEGLAAIPERKTVVLVSGGLIANDRIGGRPDASGFILEVGRQAARANVSLYALHMDSSFADAMSGRDPMSRRGPDVETMFRDGNLMAQGLEMVAGAAGGAVMRVMAGTGDSAFDRVLTETSAHYVLGVSIDEADRNGKTHAISVRLKRRGVTLRSRTLVLIPRPGQTSVTAAAEPEDLVPQEPPPVLDKPDARTPPLDVILKNASGYLDAYERDAAAMVSEETYMQKTPQPEPATSAVSRQLRSDMLIIPDSVVGWLGFRDVFEVDGEPVRNRTERLTALFTRPLPDRMAQARRIVVESSRFNLRSDVFRTINMPMMALRFLRFVDQRRSKFNLEGTQVVDGTRLAVVKFEEREKPRMIESTDDAPAKGSFWIEPASGRVMQSELLLDTGKGASRLRVRVRVAYTAAPSRSQPVAPAASLGSEPWVPATMDEEYRLGKGALAVEGHATYTNYRKFKVETNTIIKR